MKSVCLTAQKSLVTPELPCPRLTECGGIVSLKSGAEGPGRQEGSGCEMSPFSGGCHTLSPRAPLLAGSRACQGCSRVLQLPVSPADRTPRGSGAGDYGERKAASGCRAGSLSRHQMALMALFCTAWGLPRVPAPAQPHSPARGEPALGTLTGGQCQGWAHPSTQTLALGVTFGGLGLVRAQL